MQYASAVGLVRTILIILLIYFGIKILARLFMPFFLKFVAKKAEARFGDQFSQFERQRNQQKAKKEGEVTIDKIPNTKTSSKDVGEYVDFEEID
ncbi:hypothetical protein PW52_15435 [Tamlana sedimentorum]|uniref:DUF4834 domain-containing protein n=1 Tax=Neotamlana sedimentorum TaxID=1435349 RepID=A0A0D7W140_9FLAO|nr:DUF4834 family protein [Tamlana sedimentorum]KJD32749.1 hypothetical protein PW52_15435 [Tamlana sedimentorum]